MQYLASVQDTFDWVYWTGDVPPHNVWNQSRDYEVQECDQYRVNNIIFQVGMGDGGRGWWGGWGGMGGWGKG